MSDTPDRRRTIRLILFLLLSGSGLLYYVAISPQQFGNRHDDGIYVTTAKALATGEGYRIVSLPFEPAQTKYPPFYPFLLSLIWRAYPQFPDNLTSMMMLSVAATLCFLALTYRYLVKQGYATSLQALIVVGLAAINWRTIILATSIYSEMVYAALSVAALTLAEAYPKLRRGWVAGVLAGTMIGIAFLTRSSGIALLMATALFYSLKREWRRAALVVGVGSLFVVGWGLWCYLNRTTTQGVNVAYYTSYIGNLNEIINELQAVNHSSKLMTVFGLLGQNAVLLILVSVPVVCLSLDYSQAIYFGFAFLFVAAGFQRQILKELRLLYIYVALYLALHLVWTPGVAYDRFLIPLLPFLLLFLITELEMLISLVGNELKARRNILKKTGAMVVGLGLTVVASIMLYNYGSELFQSLGAVSFDKRAKPAPQDAQAIQWIKDSTEPSDTIVCYRDPSLYLYTGRKATRSFQMTSGISWRNHREAIFNIVSENTSRYLLYTSTDFENDYQPDLQRESFKQLIDQHTEEFVRVFESADGHSTIYRIQNNP